MAKYTLSVTGEELDNHLDPSSTGTFHQADQIDHEGTKVSDKMDSLDDDIEELDTEKEDVGRLTSDVDANNHKIFLLMEDLALNSAAINTKVVLPLLVKYVKTQNPDLEFVGILSASSPVPSSYSNNQAWIFYSDGEWEDLSVEIGDIVYYNSTTEAFEKQIIYSVNDLKTYIV